ncbi:transporter [Rhizobium skierniewicense]|uniref:SphA family protein n=1 Tax=Rhizobium skierniewicense TaxID=984260 RepID=UPI001FAD6278|nr:transporter [Rhizobium skierniewicense]MCI9867308.1 transporter [Rhizobium skierniewicense]
MYIFPRAINRATLSLASILSVTSLAISPAHAVEQGGTITPMGITDFSAGMLPPPSPYGTVGVRTSYYSAKTLRDAKGDKIPNDFELDVKSVSLAYFYMTEWELFGASVGFGGILPLIDIEGSVNVATPFGQLAIEGSDFGLGDVDIFPLMLAWQAPPNLFVNAGLQVQLPTGDYDVSKAFNAGVNHWTITPFVAGTYITDSGFEVSTNVTVNFNTVNPDTDYTSGIEYRQEFGVGQHIGPWTAGVGGYVYQQISDDKGPGSGDGNRARVFALGPAVNFFQPGLPMVSLHAFKEFGAENRAEGYNVALRLSMTF